VKGGGESGVLSIEDSTASSAERARGARNGSKQRGKWEEKRKEKKKKKKKDGLLILCP
jgi:hypothetical protein